MGIVGATIATGVIGAGASLYGSSKAAGSAKDAANQQMAMFNQTRGDLQPFIGPGANALSDAYALSSRGPSGPDYLTMAYDNLPGRMTQAELEQTPGYQFTRDQGLKSVQNAAAARGLGVSGASLKGAGEYVTGLASKTYLDQFNVRQKQFEDYLNLNTGQQSNFQNQFARLSDVAKIGQASAAGQATAGTAAAKTSGEYINNAGLLEAKGAMNATNALTGSLNNYLAYDQFDKYINRTPTTSGYNTPGRNQTEA